MFLNLSSAPRCIGIYANLDANTQSMFLGQVNLKVCRGRTVARPLMACTKIRCNQASSRSPLRISFKYNGLQIDFTPSFMPFWCSGEGAGTCVDTNAQDRKLL